MKQKVEIGVLECAGLKTPCSRPFPKTPISEFQFLETLLSPEITNLGTFAFQSLKIGEKLNSK